MCAGPAPARSALLDVHPAGASARAAVLISVERVDYSTKNRFPCQYTKRPADASAPFSINLSISPIIRNVPHLGHSYSLYLPLAGVNFGAAVPQWGQGPAERGLRRARARRPTSTPRPLTAPPLVPCAGAHRYL